MLEVSPLNNLTGVAAGGSVSVTLPVGRTYEKIHFEYSGVTPEQIKNLRVELQGRTLTEYGTLQDLLDENAYFKREQAAGYATLYFARPEIQGVLNPSLVEQRFFSLGTVGLSIVQIKFDIAQDATAPVIKAFAEKSSPSAPGWLFKRRTFRYNFAVGINEIENLPRPLGAKIALIEIKKAGVDSAEFLVNNVKWRDHIPAPLHKHHLKQRGRSPRANTHAIDLFLSGDVFSALALDSSINDMRLRVEASEAGSAEVVVHYFDDYAKSTF